MSTAQPIPRSATPTLRRATLAAVPAIARIAAACDEPIDTPDRPGFPYAEHLVRRATVLVAELDGQVVAYAGLASLGASVHLTDLFVQPERQGRGLGSLLLGSILPRDVAATTFSSADPGGSRSTCGPASRPGGRTSICGARPAACQPQAWRSSRWARRRRRISKRRSHPPVTGRTTTTTGRRFPAAAASKCSRRGRWQPSGWPWMAGPRASAGLSDWSSGRTPIPWRASWLPCAGPRRTASPASRSRGPTRPSRPSCGLASGWSTATPSLPAARTWWIPSGCCRTPGSAGLGVR